MSNTVGEAWRDRIPFWRRIVERTHATSFLDVGCGRGDSMLALRDINPEFELSGVDQSMPLLLEAQSHGLDVEAGTLDELPFLLPPPGFERLAEPLPWHGIADLVSLTAPISRFDADGYAHALGTLHDMSSGWVLLIDIEPTVSQKTMAVAMKALIRYAKRRLRLDQVGMAEGFGVPATFALMERAD